MYSRQTIHVIKLINDENKRMSRKELNEEAYIALREKVPVFLVGMFGGTAYSVIEQLLSNLSSEKGPTMEENDYLIFKLEIKDAKFKSIKAYFDKVTFDRLNDGLSEDENEKLFASDDFNHVIALILKGIKTCIERRFSDTKVGYISGGIILMSHRFHGISFSNLSTYRL